MGGDCGGEGEGGWGDKIKRGVMIGFRLFLIREALEK